MGVLEDFGTGLTAVPPLVLVVGHCTFVSLLTRALREKFLLSFWVGLFAAVGGGIVSGYLLQDPKVAPNPIFSGNAIIGTWTVCWWAVNYFPYSLVAGVAATLPIRAACRVCSNVLRVGTMAARCDAARLVYPGSIAAPLILGTVGGSGGKFLSDAILAGAGLAQGSSELLVPSFAWRSGVFGTTAYFVLAHGLEGWTSKEARALVTALFLTHGLLADFAGRPLDFTAPIAKVLHALLNIPMPQPQTLPVKAKDAEPSGAKSKKGK